MKRLIAWLACGMFVCGFLVAPSSLALAAWGPQTTDAKKEPGPGKEAGSGIESNPERKADKRGNDPLDKSSRTAGKRKDDRPLPGKPIGKGQDSGRAPGNTGGKDERDGKSTARTSRSSDSNPLKDGKPRRPAREDEEPVRNPVVLPERDKPRPKYENDEPRRSRQQANEDNDSNSMPRDLFETRARRSGIRLPAFGEDSIAFTFEDGPFEGLEPFGYSYFASARETVRLRRLGRGISDARPPRPGDETSEEPRSSQAEKRSPRDSRPATDPQSSPGEDKSPAPRETSKTSSTRNEKSSGYPSQERTRPIRQPEFEFDLPATGDTQTFAPPLTGNATYNFNLPAPERYQLGPGDKLTVRYSSPTEAVVQRTLTVDPAGAVVVPVMGNKLVVRGMTVAQVQASLQRELRRGIREAEVTVALYELRAISVSIVGEVIAQGSYQFPSVMTLFNALYMAGGPTVNGSMRNIQLRRANGRAITVDLYAYLLRGDASQDVALQPGDLILVPPAINRVALRGEVHRPAVYEMRPNEKVQDLLKYAGGAKSTAILDRVEIDSVNAGVERTLININLRSAAPDQNRVLLPNDIVTLYALREEVMNTITVEGAVDQPRDYQFKAGMRVADAIDQARGLLSNAYPLRADLYRENPDKTFTLIPIELEKAMRRDSGANIELRRHDRLRVYAAEEVMWLEARTITVEGAVRTPGTYLRLQGMRVADALLQAGGLLPDGAVDGVFVLRKNPDGSEGPMIRVNASRASAGTGIDNVELQDRDRIVVYKVTEAEYRPEQVVTIKGAVLTPGEYPRSESMKLKDLLGLAGGFTPDAGTSIEISHARKNAGAAFDQYSIADVATGRANPVLEDGDVVTIAQNGDFNMRPLVVEIRGRVKQPGPYAITNRNVTIAQLIERAGGLADGAWTQGAQFLRAPANLTTAAELRLSPRVRGIFELIQEQEYLRALAKSDIEKIRTLAASGNSLITSIPLLTGGAGAGQTGPTLNPATAEKLGKQLESRETVTAARSLTNEELLESGNIPIRLDLALKNPKSENNIILMDGDIISIPELPTTVAVRGSVIAPTTVLFEPGKNLGYYLDRVGGLTIDADERQILIIRGSGTITKARRSTKIELGDSVFVPTRVMVATLGDGRGSFETVFKQITNLGVIYAIYRNLLR